MPRGGLNRDRGWGSSRARSGTRSSDDDSSRGRGRGRTRRRASTTQRVDHGLHEASPSPPEMIPETQIDPTVGVGGPSERQPNPVEAHPANLGIPPPAIIMEKARIPLLASSARDRFTLFHGATDPWVARTWLRDIERTFGYMSCSDSEKVELAAYHFRGQAATWWEMQQTIFGDQVISWQLFKEAFERQYFPAAFCIARRQEFINLKQGNRSVMDYNAEFNRLAKFCPHMVAQDDQRMLHFTQGLAAYIRAKMAGFLVTTYREALDRAIMIEVTQQQISQEREASRQTSQTSHARQQSRRRFRDQDATKEDATKESSRPQKVAKVAQGSSRSLPSQHGQTPIKCFQCGAFNHTAAECSLDRSICFYCKLPGHQQKDCTLRAQHRAGGSQSQRTQPAPRPPQSRQQKGPQRFPQHQPQNPPPTQVVPQPQLYQLQSQVRSEYQTVPPLQQNLLAPPQPYLLAPPQQYLPPPPQQYLLPPPQQYPLLPYQPSTQTYQLSQDQSQPSSSVQRGQQSGSEAGRVYALTREEAQRAGGSVIRGIISVYNFPAAILIDTGSSHSFISPEFVCKIGRVPTLRSYGLSVLTPSGGY
ncbi:uncharacterized protein LOC141842807 [Curcuma longa]|uniref:uncharacterized protein LOC141842807 n=1 Tax=Curcuma longa TaxID=136217 RepID=UPI003D9F65F3